MPKTVLITGGSRGIGAAMARAFGRDGWQVAINYNENKVAAEEVAAEIGANAAVFGANVSKETEAEALIIRTKEVFGGIDLLINNAGVSSFGLFTDFTDEEARRVMDINFFGACNMLRYVLPEMVSRKKGSVINIASVWGIAGASCESIYAASKAALISLTKSLAKELGPSGIRVNAIAPGVIATDMHEALDAATKASITEEIPLGRVGTPEEVAALALFLAGENASYITGGVYPLDGGFLL
ncbi:MAG: elongation factor P 5-aminopentanone reductase [Christensenellaceae bacterium]|jgi:3-oxoacyl-[acyl-carrier protein] reductase